MLAKQLALSNPACSGPALSTGSRLRLTAANVLEALVRAGLCSRPSRAEGRWRVVDHGRRNRAFGVTDAEGKGFFLKQLRVEDRESLAMLQREASVYWLVGHAASFSPLKLLLPAFYGFDGESWILILEHIGRTTPAPTQGGKAWRVCLERGSRLGHGLARLHHLEVDACSRTAGPTFPRGLPGILTAHRHGPLTRWLGPGQRALVESIRTTPSLAHGLDLLAAGWQTDAVIHGDLRWPNVLFRPAQSPGSAPLLFLVDWELADIGDAGWDLGSALHLYGCQTPDLDFDATASAAVWQEARAMWRAYVRQASMTVRQQAVVLRRAVAFAAARWLQTALEVCGRSTSPPPAAYALLDMGRRVLAQPERIMSLVSFAPPTPEPAQGHV